MLRDALPFLIVLGLFAALRALPISEPRRAEAPQTGRSTAGNAFEDGYSAYLPPYPEPAEADGRQEMATGSEPEEILSSRICDASEAIARAMEYAYAPDKLVEPVARLLTFDRLETWQGAHSSGDVPEDYRSTQVWLVGFMGQGLSMSDVEQSMGFGFLSGSTDLRATEGLWMSFAARSGELSSAGSLGYVEPFEEMQPYPTPPPRAAYEALAALQDEPLPDFCLTDRD